MDLRTSLASRVLLVLLGVCLASSAFLLLAGQPQQRVHFRMLCFGE